VSVPELFPTSNYYEMSLKCSIIAEPPPKKKKLQNLQENNGENVNEVLRPNLMIGVFDVLCMVSFPIRLLYQYIL